MSSTARTPPHSPRTAVLVGVAAGVGVLAVYLGTGLLVAGWGFDEFLSRLTIGVVASVAFTGGMVVASVAVPVALYLRYRLVAPLALLAVVGVGWFVYGALSGVLTSGNVYGFTLYLFFLAPVFVGLFLVVGGGEFLVRARD